MNEQDLENLFRDLESERVERKASASDRKDIQMAICAFANDRPNYRQPGVIFIGVNDDGTCANLRVTDELLRLLADMRSNGNILPFPVLSVRQQVINGCPVAVVVLEPSADPPVRFDGRVWIRVGPRRALATAEEEWRLTEKRRARDILFDISPLPSATLADLNLDFLRFSHLPATLNPEVLRENQRPLGQQLASLRLVTPGPEPHPTVLGLMVRGINPTQFIPGYYVQFLRIDGLELVDPIKDQKEISGTLMDILRQLDEVLKINISTASDIARGPLEVRRGDYPLEAPAG